MQSGVSPQHYLIVENADWSGVMKARAEGAAWDSLRTRTGLPALLMAIQQDSPVAVQILLEVGAPTQPQALFDGEVRSPLWAALNRGNADILDLLLLAGASPDEPHPQSGICPLDAAATRGDAASTIVLCKRGARPNTNTTPSPLWMWINHLCPVLDANGNWRFQDASPILALLRAGARVEKPTEHGMGVDALSLARRKWLENPLPESDVQEVKLVLAALERATLMEQVDARSSGNQHKGQNVSRL